MDTAWSVLTIATAVGAALVAGVLFAFSGFVMRALAELDPAAGVAAMQAINRRAVTPPFMTALFGTAVGCIAVTVGAFVDQGGPHPVWTLVGAAAYLIGVVGLTAGYHVPRNDALARLVPNAAETAPPWRRYVSTWTAANHLREAAGLVSATALLAATPAG